jgi:integrase/recombinase XerD
MAGLPLSQAIEEYLAWLELDRHASLGTVAGYRGDLRRFSDFAGGDAGIPDIAELDRDILRGYQRHLARLRTGPKGARRPLAISTRSRRLVALRSFLRFAAREEWLPGDLGTTIDVPKLPERLPKPLEAGDRDQLLEALPHDTLPELRDRALILLLLSTGARISEILRLDRSDWKPDRMWVLGKGDRERVVQVTDKARLAVQEYLTARVDHSPALFIGFQPASKAASSQPPHHRRCAARLPPTRPTARDPRLSPPPAAAHTRNPAPGDDGRRPAHRRNTRPPRAGVGQRLHQNHRPASARGV